MKSFLVALPLVLTTCAYLVSANDKCEFDASRCNIEIDSKNVTRITGTGEPRYVAEMMKEQGNEYEDKETVLCRTFVDSFRDRSRLTFDALALDAIEPGAFDGLTNLKTLEITRNNLMQILHGVFNNLTIRALSLENNGIFNIQLSALDHMPNLRYLNLNNNKLKWVKAEWFAAKRALNVIEMRYNRIAELEGTPFTKLTATEDCRPDGDIGDVASCPRIHLSHNRIRSIDTQVLTNLYNISLIDLDDNDLEKVPMIHSYAHTKVVSLQYNAIKLIESERLEQMEKSTTDVYLYANPLAHHTTKKMESMGASRVHYQTRKKHQHKTVHEI